MASKKGMGSVLWGDDDSTAKSRSSGTNLSGARFSTRDYAVDQSVNLMAMDDAGNVGDYPGTGGIAGLFRASTGTDASRFDEYGDAAPSGEAEEYISDKQRRTAPFCASVRNFLASKSFCSLFLGIIGLFLLGGGIFLAVTREEDSSEEKDLRSFLIGKGISSEEAFSGSVPTPQNAALKWLIHEDPAKLGIDDKGFVDRYILAVFYFGSNDKSDGWNRNTNWMTGTGICMWEGVQCAPKEVAPTAQNNFQKFIRSYDENDHITGLLLENNNIQGVIPEEFGSFPELLTLDLSDNEISGSIPTTLGQLSKIRDLLLRKNTLFGPFPFQLTKLDGLHQLHLGENQLEGTISDNISEMKNLRALSLSSNMFEGVFPFIQPMTFLIKLHLDDNQFTGTIPLWMWKRTDLRELRLGKNKFTGTIPDDLKSLRNLETLHLDGNLFEGTFPNAFDSVPRIRDLKLDRNKFTGPLPETIWHLQGLKHLALDNNKFSGTIGGNIGTLVDVVTLSLHVNQLTGSIPYQIGFLDDLEYLTLNSNKLTGSLPSDLGNCFRLKKLILEQNMMKGEIPTELSNLDRLTEARFELNEFTGSIPDGLCNLKKTEDLTYISADCKSEVTCHCCNQCT